MLLWAVATFLMGFAGGFLSLLVLRVMLGVGESIAFPGSSKIIAEQVQPNGAASPMQSSRPASRWGRQPERSPAV